MHSLICVDMGRSVKVFFRQVEQKRRILVEFLIPVKILDGGIAKDCARN